MLCSSSHSQTAAAAASSLIEDEIQMLINSEFVDSALKDLLVSDEAGGIVMNDVEPLIAEIERSLKDDSDLPMIGGCLPFGDETMWSTAATVDMFGLGGAEDLFAI